MSKTILITGASTGIGRATAFYFQQKGWNVIATMRTPEKEAERGSEKEPALTNLANVLVLKLDVLDLSSIEHAVAKGIETFGKIDVLLNNAGYGAFGPLEAFTREKIIRQFDTNVIGLLDTTRAILPHFRKNKDGVIINVSSIGGKMTFPLGALYHGTKFAVEGISEALNFEMNAIGVKVKLVEPGAIETDFGNRSLDFANDESMTGYQGVVGALMKLFTEPDPNRVVSSAELVAEIIFKAATDGADTLRYRAGADAEQILDARKNMKDDEFTALIKARFGL